MRHTRKIMWGVLGSVGYKGDEYSLFSLPTDPKSEVKEVDPAEVQRMQELAQQRAIVLQQKFAQL